MKKRVDFFQNIENINFFNDLKHINTIGELKKHVGKLLLFCTIDTYCGTNKILCAWFGILKDKNLNYDDLCSIGKKKIWIDKSFYIYRRSTFLNINDDNLKETFRKMELENEVSYCNGQEYILIPNAKLLAYYNLCMPKLEYLIKNYWSIMP